MIQTLALVVGLLIAYLVRAINQLPIASVYDHKIIEYGSMRKCDMSVLVYFGFDHSPKYFKNASFFSPINCSVISSAMRTQSFSWKHINGLTLSI